MKEEMERMKTKNMKITIKEDCGLKDYVREGNLYTARKQWKVRYFMLRVAGNYPLVFKTCLKLGKLQCKSYFNRN